MGQRDGSAVQPGLASFGFNVSCLAQPNTSLGSIVQYLLANDLFIVVGRIHRILVFYFIFLWAVEEIVNVRRFCANPDHRMMRKA